jgi:hypothetical protein
VTDTNPADQPPSPDSYEVCAYQLKALDAGESRAFPCVATGRYVIVQLLYRRQLVLCEVQVFGGRVCFFHKFLQQFVLKTILLHLLYLSDQ